MTDPDGRVAAEDVLRVFDAVTAALPSSEQRSGQRQMAEQVAAAITTGRHLVVQAGTGTGKTLAYLVPALVTRTPTIVATATKALQDQLATKDLPFVAAQLAKHGIDVDWAVLKGRSNYLCLQRLREFTAPAQAQLELDEPSPLLRAEVLKLAEWAGRTGTGDAAELDWNPSEAAWRAVSVGSDECPGADRCPLGRECFTERARERAATSDVVVVNTHLYGVDVAALGAIMPEHELVVFDEAHGLEDTISDTVGVELTPGRFVTVGAAVRAILAEPEASAPVLDLASMARQALGAFAGQRLRDPLPEQVVELLDEARLRLARVSEQLAQVDTKLEDAQQRKLRAMSVAARALESVELALAERDGTVAFVSGTAESPRLEIAPLDVGPTLFERVWSKRTAVLTSATVPASLVPRVGLPAERTDVVDVGSPFDYADQALLYCAMQLPNPKSPKYRDAVADELAALIEAAGGRTLALFTSWAAMDHAVAAVRPA